MNQVPNDHAVRVVAGLLKQLDDAYPDVGMGLPASAYTAQALRLLGLSEADVSEAAWKR